MNYCPDSKTKDLNLLFALPADDMRQTRTLAGGLVTLKLADRVDLHGPSAVAVTPRALSVGRDVVVEGVAVESLRTSLAIEAGGIVDAFEALAGDAIAVADGVPVEVTGALAGSARAPSFADLFDVAGA